MATPLPTHQKNIRQLKLSKARLLTGPRSSRPTSRRRQCTLWWWLALGRSPTNLTATPPWGVTASAPLFNGWRIEIRDASKSVEELEESKLQAEVKKLKVDKCKHRSGKRIISSYPCIVSILSTLLSYIVHTSFAVKIAWNCDFLTGWKAPKKVQQLVPLFLTCYTRL